ncbi:pilus assembly PilX N-terminal domain-containing protein [Halomonas sp. CKK8]|uniref:pilus assembly PilX family protein n=1 Tax=Halomonas sp. CKK8 TaxID=3036127 RepID=UPI002414DBC9|nr:pilus assembly PilX N-terminal domain-containing protein [Halomonas sp. CKK8]WFM70964.1 pilus assembly PilX N-terminal domain-containing protein [Halomonas sp. CKK8]
MKHQKGAALIVVLSLLTVSLMVGLSSMQSSHIDERLAGNYRAASQAQMNSESAASELFSEILAKNKSVWAGFDELDQGFGWDGLEGLASLSSNSAHCSSFSFSEGEGVACYVRVSSANGLELGSGDYILALGRAGGGGSEPVIVSLDGGGFSLNSALTVLGGIQDIESNHWYPKSDNGSINAGLDSSSNSLYYEGTEHSCGEAPNSEVCYGDLGNDAFVGSVEYGGTYRQESRDLLSSLYGEIDGHSSLLTDENFGSDAQWIGRDDSCEDADIYQVAFLRKFEAKNNSRFCGVVIVWGGDVQLKNDNDNWFGVSGNENVYGSVIVGNFLEVGGEPDFNFSSEVKIVVNGGGVDGSIYFDRTYVAEALKRVGVSSAEESYLGGVGGGVPDIISWQ